MCSRSFSDKSCEEDTEMPREVMTYSVEHMTMGQRHTLRNACR